MGATPAPQPGLPLLLALLRGAPPPAAEAALWEAAAHLAEQENLAPYLMLRHREALPPAIVARWRPLMHWLTSHNWSLRHDEDRILARLAEAGIPVVPLKGVRLAEALYGTIGARAVYDIDILVPDEKVERAAELLRADGWQIKTPEQYSAAHARRLHHHWVFKRDGAHLDDVTLELHWSLMRSTALGLPPALLWAHVVQPAAGQWRLAPEVQLVHLALHLFQHNFAPVSRVLDLAAFLGRFGEALGAAELDALCQAPSRRAIVALTCLVAAQSVGERLPPVLAQWAGWRVRLAARRLPLDRLFAPPLFAFSRYYSGAALLGAWPIFAEQAARALFDPYDVELSGPLARLLHPLRLAGRYSGRLWRQATTRTTHSR